MNIMGCFMVVWNNLAFCCSKLPIRSNGHLTLDFMKNVLNISYMNKGEQV